MERHHENREHWLAAALGQVDPMNYAGEGFSDPEEIARGADVANNPWLRGRVEGAGSDDYWPGPKGKK